MAATQHPREEPLPDLASPASEARGGPDDDGPDDDRAREARGAGPFADLASPEEERRVAQGALDARRSRDFAAGFFLTTLGVLTSVGIAAGWLAPQGGVVHPLNAPHVWLPYVAGLWFLHRSSRHEESQQRLEDRWRSDRRDQDRLAYFADCTDKELVARVIVALARANDAHAPAGPAAGRAVDDITSRR